MTLKLVSPQIEHESLWLDILSEFEKAGEKIKPYPLKFGCSNYKDFLQKTNDFKNSLIPQELSHLVPATTYFLMDEAKSRIFGAINIRHELNQELIETGGNIGYGIRPSERMKGYATKMLSLALGKCHDIGLNKVLITCNKDNIGSKKTILHNGGIFEDEFVEDNGNIVLRYYILL